MKHKKAKEPNVLPLLNNMEYQEKNIFASNKFLWSENN